MKLVLAGTALLLGLAFADGLRSGAQEGAHPLCRPGGTSLRFTPDQERHHFMREAEAPPNIDFSMLAVTPQADRHYFILTPPIRQPHMGTRLCGSDWLEELAPGGLPLERFDFGP